MLCNCLATKLHADCCTVADTKIVHYYSVLSNYERNVDGV